MDIECIRKAIQERRINVTDHADEELAADEISDEDLFQSVLTGEVIEDYPEDFPFPSCLIYGRDPKGRPIHSVWASAEPYRIAILVTAYVPDPVRWIDFRIRRRR